jgi:hypothetical protein
LPLIFPVSNFPVIFSRLEGALFRLQCILANADDEAAGISKNGWSVKEELGHLSTLKNCGGIVCRISWTEKNYDRS